MMNEELKIGLRNVINGASAIRSAIEMLARKALEGDDEDAKWRLRQCLREMGDVERHLRGALIAGTASAYVVIDNGYSHPFLLILSEEYPLEEHPLRVGECDPSYVFQARDGFVIIRPSSLQNDPVARVAAGECSHLDPNITVRVFANLELANAWSSERARPDTRIWPEESADDRIGPFMDYVIR